MINLTISADTAEGLLDQLAALVSMRMMFGVEPTADNIGATPEEMQIAAEIVEHAAATTPPAAKSNGADVVEMPKRTRGKKAAPPPAPEAAEPVDRQAIIKGLTDIYMTAAPGVRDKITAFRDGQGVQRLRELKDDAIPAAAKLLNELAAEEAAAP
jgi:hypothetical protein